MKPIYESAVMGLIVGDALGAPVEFGERFLRDLNPVKGMRSGGMFEVPEGGWTDDTSMVLATIDSLKHGFDPEDMMLKFLAWLRSGLWLRRTISKKVF